MLKQRLITAAILIPITLAILFFSSPPVFCLITALLVLAAGWEWTSLMQLDYTGFKIGYLILMAVLMVMFLFIPTPLIFFASLLWWLFALVLVLTYPRGSGFWGKSVVIKGVMGALVLLPCWVAINYIRNEANGTSILLFLFVLIWGADSAAYFAGKKWGKTKLSPTVSPGKSVQGLFAALLFAVVITLVVLFTEQPGLQIYIFSVLLALVTVLFSILGDLFESMLKRIVGVKDSSNILPGHGGILDRIDSLTAAAPIYALGSLVLSIFLLKQSVG